ncbi:MAG: phage tail protein [Eubacteriales bacterium]|nr:phage tail protein [Eubacteriales bacterium]
MSNNTANVTTGKPKVGGAVFTAPAGTTLPTSASAELNSAFVCVGYCSEDGLTNSNSPETSTVKAWGGDIVLVTESEKKDTFKFTMLEGMDPNALKAVYGDSNVSGDISTGITVRANNALPVAHVWVFDMLLTNNTPKRIVVPNAIVSGVDDIEYKDGDPVKYGITLTAMPGGESFGYDTHKEYIGPTGATGATGATS